MDPLNTLLPSPDRVSPVTPRAMAALLVVALGAMSCGGGDSLSSTPDQGAAASPNPVTGTTSVLTVQGAAGGDAGLVYTWAATGSPVYS